VPAVKGSASAEIRADSGVVYDLLADITRMGEWSDECYRCEWIDGATGAAVGARFRGYNRSGPFRWSNVSRICSAERGQILAWAMGPDDAPYTAWQYTFAATADGVTVTESFESLRHTFLGWLGARPLRKPTIGRAKSPAGQAAPTPALPRRRLAPSGLMR